MGKIPVALGERVAVRMLVHETIHAQRLRVGQRTPKPLAATGLRHQAITVVHFGPEVVEVTTARAVLAVQEHRRERRNSDFLDGAPRIQFGADLNLRGGAGSQFELIRTGHAGAVEDGVDRQGALLGFGAHQPEVGEVGKLFPVGGGRVDGQSARRESVDLIAAQHAEVRRAEKHHHFVFVGGRIERVVDAKPRKAEFGGQLHLRDELAELEQGRVVADRSHSIRTHFIDVDAPVEIESSMEELNFEQGFVEPQRALTVKTDVSKLVVVQLLESLRQSG